jgi:H+/Cl- antiporter ClcA
MFQQMNLTAANDARIYRDARADEAWSGSSSRAHQPSRARARGADLVLSCLCSMVALLAIDSVGDRSLLFEHYDFKLWSYRDRLTLFCLSVIPSLIGMALVLVAYKAISVLRSVL